MIKPNSITTRELTTAAIIAAVYCALTLMTIEFSFGGMQVRVAEALTILPVFTPAAIPGLFVGCFISNLIGGVSLLDRILGPLATLAAAMCTRSLRRESLALAALPPVLINAAVIGLVLHLEFGSPYVIFACSVGLGQIAACYGLGLPLACALRKLPADLLS